MRNEDVINACFGFFTLVKISLICVLEGTDNEIRMVAKEVLVTVQANPVTLAVHTPGVGVTSVGKYTSMKLPEMRLLEVLKIRV